MASPAVHWHEGLFLRPQQFQSTHRYQADQLDRATSMVLHYNWGIAALELDLDALSNSRLVIRTLDARLRDGTLLRIPEDGTLPTIDLKAPLAASGRLVVSVSIPSLQSGRANVSGENGPSDTRYRVEAITIEDENTGLNTQRLQVRRLNLKLLTNEDDQSGYETLPIVAVQRADRPEAVPQLDEGFIPALLACEAWKPLHAGILQPIYDRIGRKIDLLSSQVVTRGVTFDSQVQGDRLIFEQLRVLNEVYARLGVEVFARGMHPLPMYLELCELVGRLSIFSAERRPPQLPAYDHDDLGTCYWRIKQYLDALLDIVLEPEYKERPFLGAGLRMQVSMEPAWLEAGWKLFVGVLSSLPAEECVQFLTGTQDMKIGSSERVDEVYRMGLAGLRFSYTATPPRSLPRQPGLVYFQVDRGAQRDEWDYVERSLSLAVRLNENLIVGNIQGQRVLNLKLEGRTLPMQMSLYVMPEGKE